MCGRPGNCGLNFCKQRLTLTLFLVHRKFLYLRTETEITTHQKLTLLAFKIQHYNICSFISCLEDNSGKALLQIIYAGFLLSISMI